MVLLLSQPGHDFSGGKFFTIATASKLLVFRGFFEATAIIPPKETATKRLTKVDGRKQEANMNCGDLLIFRTSCKHGCTRVRLVNGLDLLFVCL